MVVSELALLQVQGERPWAESAEARQSCLGISPEGLDAVDVDLAADELIPAMIDADMGVTHLSELVVGAPAVGINDGCGFDAFENNPLQ